MAYFKIARSLLTGEKVSTGNYVTRVEQRAADSEENENNYIVAVENHLLVVASNDENSLEEMELVLKKEFVKIHKQKELYLEEWSKL